MAHPSSAQSIVPVTQVCKTFSANRPCALFTRVPPVCTSNASFSLSAPCNVPGVLFHKPPFSPIQKARRTIHHRKASYYLRTCRIISPTVDIVRRCREALRLSKDYFGRGGKLPLYSP